MNKKPDAGLSKISTYPRQEKAQSSIALTLGEFYPGTDIIA